MRLSLKNKLPLLLLATVLLSMVWLGYWIGSIQYRTHILRLQDRIDKLSPSLKASTKEELTSARLHGLRQDLAGGKSSPLQRIRNLGDIKGENVFVVGREGKVNEAINSVGEVNARQHALGIHEGHANMIRQHVNRGRDPEAGLGSRSRPATSREGKAGGGRNLDLPDTLRQESDRREEGGASERWGDKHGPFRAGGGRGGGSRETPGGAGGRTNHDLPDDEVHLSRSGQDGRLQVQGVPPLEDANRGRPGKAHVEGGQEGSDRHQEDAVEEFRRLRQRLREEAVPKLKEPPARTVANFRDTFQQQAAFDPSGTYYALLHSGVATKVHGKLHADLRALPAHIKSEVYTFKAKSLPKSPRLRPSVANGQLGTAIHSPEVFMNGVYSGPRNESHRAVIPSTVSFNITSTEPATNFTRTYILNAGEGVYSEESVSPTYTLTQRIYAHRKYSRLLVVEVDLVRQETRNPLKLMVKLNRWQASGDITFLTEDSGMDEVSYKFGSINSPETNTSPRTQVHIFYDHVPNELVPVRGAVRTKWVFLTSIGHTKKEALDAYKLGSQLVRSNDQLYADHVRAWASVWAAGRVDVVGNLPLAMAIYGAYYYILSSMPLSEDPTAPFIGLSPSGLPFGDFTLDYEGHVFWDQETWMYPAILPLWPSLGRLLLNTRHRTMKAAAENARLNGHQGLQYPWESAFTGSEVSPGEKYAKREIHISGDISRAILQYVQATGDLSILREKEKFAYILTGIANFYVSVLKWNSTRAFYEIRGVMCPDEYADHVNNSVYTNAVARAALLATELIFKRANRTLDRYLHIAKDIYIPYSLSKKFHPEYDGYAQGTKVKQADAIMLGYPLMVEMDRRARSNDLKIYEKVTDITGPAMSWSMFTIGYLELHDEGRAEAMFKRNFQYIRNDFQVWHETVYGKGATNFLTGMGGFLQAVIYGYGGLRFQEDRLDLEPVLPLDCTELHFTGLNYLGATLDIFIQDDSILVNLLSPPSFSQMPATPTKGTSRKAGQSSSAKQQKQQEQQQRAPPELVLYIYKTEQTHSLKVNQAVRIPRQHATITTTKGITSQ